MPSPVCFYRGDEGREAAGAEGRWGERPTSPALGGGQCRTSAPRQPNGSRDPSQDPAPCHQKSSSFPKISQDTVGGFLVLFQCRRPPPAKPASFPLLPHRALELLQPKQQILVDLLWFLRISLMLFTQSLQ